MIDVNYIKKLVASLMDIEMDEIQDVSKVFVDLEMDSMTFLEMIHRIEKENHIKFEHKSIKFDLTISDIVEAVNLL